MSHFTVMVFGENVEEQLAPFHEFECTGTNDQYVQDVDITDELGLAEGASLGEIKYALGGWGLEDKIVSDESEVEKDGDLCEHKYGYAIVKDGKLIKAVNRTNPNKQWDWYQIGGRWSGMLRLKPNAQGRNGNRSWMNRDEPKGSNFCDSAPKKDIDVEFMRNEAGEAAAKRWDAAYAVTQGRIWKTWEEVQESITASSITPNVDVWAARREFYNGQQVIAELRKSFDPFHDLDQYMTPREAFIQTARNSAMTTFAVI